MGLTMFVPSMVNDSVTALDIRTGDVKWRFPTGGPVRFAPAAWNNKVYVVSDDGFLYCLDADNGKLLWKFRGAPAAGKVLGNGRLISTWPARGGPVLADGKVYFAAGIWPSCSKPAREKGTAWCWDWARDGWSSSSWASPSCGLWASIPIPERSAPCAESWTKPASMVGESHCMSAIHLPLGFPPIWPA